MSRLGPAALRALATTLLVALWLDAPVGRARPGRLLVALDASASLTRGGDTAAWARARTIADSLGGQVVLIGDGVQSGPVPERPALPASRVAPLVDRALAEGRTVALVTDGEIEDPDALRRLPAGSRVFVARAPDVADAGIARIEAPAVAMTNDTVSVRVHLLAGGAGAAATQLAVTVDGAVEAPVAVAPMAAWEERTVEVRRTLGRAGGRVLRATLGAGDREPRNDTVSVAIDVLDQPSALVLSTAPDADVRWIDAGVRAALGAGVQTWWRVAPGEWRRAPSLDPVPETDVRRAAADASVVVLHGDTAFFGAPATALRGARWLIPSSDAEGEWYASPSADGAPVGDLLAGASPDSLPPLSASAAPALEWTALVARRDKRGDGVPILTGRTSAPRTVVLSAAGFSRWGLRGGEAAAALPALAGGIAAWLAESAPERRAAVPTQTAWREGEPITWRRGGRDSTVVVRWSAAGQTGVDTLRFGASGTTAVGRVFAPGRVDAEVPGGRVVLVVNASGELLPRRAVVEAGPVGEGLAESAAPSARDWLWLYAVVILALSAEWVLRRRAGLR
jgi:hypothetical protein